MIRDVIQAVGRSQQTIRNLAAVFVDRVPLGLPIGIQAQAVTDSQPVGYVIPQVDGSEEAAHHFIVVAVFQRPERVLNTIVPTIVYTGLVDWIFKRQVQYVDTPWSIEQL